MSTIDQINQQYALGMLQLNLQQAYNTAYQTKQTLANQQLTAAQAHYFAQAADLAALESQKKTIATTRYVLNYENAAADRSILSLLNAANDIKQSLSFNVDQMYNQVNSAVGSIKAKAGSSGTIANVGTNKDIQNQTISESKKDIANTVKSSMGDLNQVYEQVLSEEIAKSFNNWQVETQIQFSTDMFNNSRF